MKIYTKEKLESERRLYDIRYKEWRNSVLDRDGHKCTRCGSTEKLHVHHKKEWHRFPELRYEISNGKTVCFSCHVNIHPYMVKYVGKKHGKHEKFISRKQRRENNKKFRSFKRRNGFRGMKIKKLSNKYDGYKFTKDNPNPNWG